MFSRLPVPKAAAGALADHLTVTSIPVQWGDQDAFGHVNNVVYFRWLESARIDLLAHFSSNVGMSREGLGPILASMHCDYRRQLHFPDVVHIGSRIQRVGRSSVEVGHVVFSEQLSAIAAEASSTLVIFDYQTNRPVRIPDELRRQFEQTGTGA